MLTKIINILNALCDGLARLMKWKDAADREKLRKAITEGDREAVNRDVDRILKLVPLAALLALFSGCASSYTVIPADRELIPVERVDDTFFKASQKGGQVDGWYVPTPVLLELRDKIKTED